MSDQKLIEMATSLGRIEGKLDEALKADRARLDKLEGAQNRQWWMSYVVTPVLMLSHAVARRFGVVI